MIQVVKVSVDLRANGPSLSLQGLEQGYEVWQIRVGSAVTASECARIVRGRETKTTDRRISVQLDRYVISALRSQSLTCSLAEDGDVAAPLQRQGVALVFEQYYRLRS